MVLSRLQNNFPCISGAYACLDCTVIALTLYSNHVREKILCHNYMSCNTCLMND